MGARSARTYSEYRACQASFAMKNRYAAPLKAAGGATIIVARQSRLGIAGISVPVISVPVISVPGISVAMALLCVACATAPAQSPGTGEALAKIRFDLSRLNDSGLQGPPDGLRALDYEFCIPSGEMYATEIKAIDPSATVYSRSPGRIGCAGGQSLVIGNTHQPDFREILTNLAARPYVTRIDESFFE